ncbi:tRNA (adenosine(37)-N6)-threonylcarbamoyltransferase complex dimerization subunit type 1 TsaB [Thermodesulfobacterium sp. TA1]|uniref:tRNA (adenosine(37)-N6)-threonylcarbamoyltransferase complex dimerization subunit type 1 TsaB n=1 Tax=Thermodesulfobacterium sp. TA1 TaxID=2234087 RepID=UPI001231E1B1|nr:tRNA (adenosine(37)-N6)-threonylcarbamoyltransferase complex dimerization subunit type 1 TsaB [Thermodesulfobacterium sp. TA1]QER41523.1 tRNA (adenosine(37)-N6)-threonylcarbamoyltransferase complex dimerization subunit type 1 TsaB [Thermodesulfobacterium sp. TA1]
MEAPLVLAIETAGKSGGIALLKEKLLGAVTLSSKQSYSQIVFRCLEFFEKNLNLDLKTLDYYAVDIGPGSFTGLRIGLSVLKGLSLAFPKPIIPLISLEILAVETFNTQLPVVSLIDAYSQEVFLAVYRWEEGRLKAEINPSCIPFKKIPELIKEPAWFVSETIEKWEDYFKQTLGKNFLKWPFPVSLTTENLAKLVYLKLKSNYFETKTAEELLPLYLKPSEAERKKRS